jgi:DNA-binding NtrC family response regulator
MPPLETLPEPTRSAAPRVPFFIHVLSYEDLLADTTIAFRLDRAVFPVTIGRADDGPIGWRSPSELRAADRWMSAVHAILDKKGPAHVVVDQGSKNGTYVNGERTTEHRLGDGDLLEIGHSLFCYRTVEAEWASDVGAGVRVLSPTRTHSDKMALLCRDVSRVASATLPVLILGETGTGKEIVARGVHERSGRKGAFCAVDCGAVPDSLFESTFFGHRRGAFTGAGDARDGEIVRADEGTLFLDEVGNLSPAGQAKLLRVLEDGRVTPLGADTERIVDVRWIAATNRDLFAAKANEPPFREDLLRRLAGHIVRLPLLRERREDLGLLAAHLLSLAGVKRGSITAAAGRVLFPHDFPGNIRQLRTMLTRATLLCGDGAIDVTHLPSEEAPEEDEESPAQRKATDAPAPAEIEAALEATGGNVVRAAQRLGTHPRQVYRWLERFALPLERFRR